MPVWHFTGSHSVDNETFALVKTLIPSAEKLCTDSTTHARIDEHWLKFAFPGIVMEPLWFVLNKYHIIFTEITMDVVNFKTRA